MIIVGLTGSIGMGKSTTARMFEEAGVPVNDADKVVHDLYEDEAVALIERAFPGSTENGAVDRQKLGSILAAKPERFSELESIVHPLVREKEEAFLRAQRAMKRPFVILDIPLLFETGGESRVDVVIVVSCDDATQKKRVLARPGMTAEKFELIKSRQIPDHEKRKRADFIVDSSKGIDDARRQVQEIIDKLNQRAGAEA